MLMVIDESEVDEPDVYEVVDVYDWMRCVYWMMCVLDGDLGPELPASAD